MRAPAVQPVDGNPHSLPKALQAGFYIPLTLDQTMADRLDIGTWHYRADADRVIVTGCLALHLLGVEVAELPLTALIDRLATANASRLAAGLRTAPPIDSITFESHGDAAEPAWFRMSGHALVRVPSR
jgi:hypothetical protein